MRLRVLAVLLVGVLTASCGTAGFSGLYQVSLPGGADLGEHPYRVVAKFSDVLDLVPQAGVKVDDVTVGKVEKITLADDNETAVVTMVLAEHVRLPANADAALRQSSLLGEKYVELSRPQGGKGQGNQGQGKLRDGAVIPAHRTNRTPQVEEVLGALSLLLNGGGIEQVRTIVREVNSALDGNEAELRALLSNVRTLARDLDGQRENISQAIDSLDRLAGSLAGQRDKIATALDDLGPGIKVINNQREQLVSMLKALDKLSGTAVNTVNRTKQDLIENLQLLAPTLEELAETGENLPKSLQMLITYPFPDYVLKTIKGDFTNVHVNFDLDLSRTLRNILRQKTPLVELPDILSAAGGSGSADEQDPNAGQGSGRAGGDGGGGAVPGGTGAGPGGADAGQPGGSDGTGGVAGLFGELLGGS